MKSTEKKKMGRHRISEGLQKPLTISTDPVLRQQLEQCAKYHGKSVSAITRLALRSYLYRVGELECEKLLMSMGIFTDHNDLSDHKSAHRDLSDEKSSCDMNKD